MKENAYTQAITAVVLISAQTKIYEAHAVLSQYIVALTPAGRLELPKMGENAISFVEKVYNFTQQPPNFAPPYLTMADFVENNFGETAGIGGIFTLGKDSKEAQEFISEQRVKVEAVNND